tara:strand:- start:272 stop:493 length:222 start_codon:yes stop_codon:yes gene_type:complete
MKITKEQLKKIIKEELEAVTQEMKVEESYQDWRHDNAAAECEEVAQRALADGATNDEAMAIYNRCMGERVSHG